MENNRFSSLADAEIASFIEGEGTKVGDRLVLDSVESVSDLWMLANMMKSQRVSPLQNGLLEE